MKTVIFNEDWKNIPAGAEVQFSPDDERLDELFASGIVREPDTAAPTIIVSGDAEASGILQTALGEAQVAKSAYDELLVKYDALVNAKAILETALQSGQATLDEANNRAEENRKLAIQLEGERDLAVSRGNELLAAIQPENLKKIAGVKPEVAQAIFSSIVKTDSKG